MKRFMVLIILLAFVSVLGCTSGNLDYSGSSAILLDQPLTDATSVTSTASTTASGMVYTDYEDLRNQLYERIYADIYEDLYADLGLENMVTEALYEEIYQAVEDKFDQLLEESDLSVLLDDTQERIYAVADLVKKSVVGISSYYDLEGQSLGSGVVYDYDEINDLYYVVTNHHVVETGNNFKVVFVNSSSVVATLIGYDSDVDIALLSFSGSGIDYDIQLSPLGNSQAETPGAIVLAAGNPQGYDFYGSITMGVLSGVDRSVDGSTIGYLQHDASINSGNSGGPLYNLDGEVIGINVSKYAATDIEGLGFAIPIDLVKTVIATIDDRN